MIDWTTHSVSFEPGYSGTLVLKSFGKMRFLSGQVFSNGTWTFSTYTKVASLPAELNGTIVGTQATCVGRSGGDTLTTVTISEANDRKIELRAISGSPTWCRFSMFWFVQ